MRLDSWTHRVRKFHDNRDGAALVEFVFVLPVMALAYCGTVDAARLVMASRKLSQLTSTLADLTARVSPVGTTEVSNILDAAGSILIPFDSSDAKMVIASIVIDDKKVARVCWSSASKDQKPLDRGVTVTIPGSVNVADTSVIMARATYEYKPLVTSLPVFNYLFDYILPSTITLGGSPIYTRPRSGTATGTRNIEQVVRSDVQGCPTF